MSPSKSDVSKCREDVAKFWDRKRVVIRQQSVGSTIVYPQLSRGASYATFSLRDEWVLAKVRSIREGILWANHHYYEYSIFGNQTTD